MHKKGIHHENMSTSVPREKVRYLVLFKMECSIRRHRVEDVEYRRWIEMVIQNQNCVVIACLQ